MLSVFRGDNRTMSIIIDGMDQNNCKVPYDGSQTSFSNSLKQVSSFLAAMLLCGMVLINSFSILCWYSQ
jgi:hypothetical protein